MFRHYWFPIPHFSTKNTLLSSSNFSCTRNMLHTVKRIFLYFTCIDSSGGFNAASTSLTTSCGCPLSLLTGSGTPPACCSSTPMICPSSLLKSQNTLFSPLSSRTVSYLKVHQCLCSDPDF